MPLASRRFSNACWDPHLWPELHVLHSAFSTEARWQSFLRWLAVRAPRLQTFEVSDGGVQVCHSHTFVHRPIIEHSCLNLHSFIKHRAWQHPKIGALGVIGCRSWCCTAASGISLYSPPDYGIARYPHYADMWLSSFPWKRDVPYLNASVIHLNMSTSRVYQYMISGIPGKCINLAVSGFGTLSMMFHSSIIRMPAVVNMNF